MLHQMDTDGTALNAMILRSASTSSKAAASVSSVKKAKARTVRGVKKAVIVKPRTRSGSGSVKSKIARPAAPSVPIKASCGDKLVIGDLGEECDDGNTVGGDGCSGACKVETGFYCGGTPSTCVSRCGDGVVTSKEKCDDGNVEAGDGCSAACKVELGYLCKNAPSFCELIPYCGDGVKASTEQCDDGNSDAGDGCHLCKTE